MATMILHAPKSPSLTSTRGPVDGDNPEVAPASEGDEMPAPLHQFLLSLRRRDADDVAEWLDETPDAIPKMTADLATGVRS